VKTNHAPDGADAGFDALMDKLTMVERRIDVVAGIQGDASRSAVKAEEIWLWMFVLPVLATLAAMLAIVAMPAGTFG